MSSRNNRHSGALRSLHSRFQPEFGHLCVLLDLGCNPRCNPWSFTSLAAEIETMPLYLLSCYLVFFHRKGCIQKYTDEHRKKSAPTQQVGKDPWGLSRNSREKKAPDCWEITYSVKQFSIQLLTAVLLPKIPHPSSNIDFFAFLLNATLLGKKEFKAQRHIISA